MNRKTALLVIDAQTGIIEGMSHDPVYQKEALLQTIHSLVTQARSRHIPVLYVQDLDVAPEGDPAFAIHPSIAPAPHEPVFRKKATDAFHGTDLHERLQEIGIDHLVIAGCKTEYCIDSACRRATTLGYDVTLVGDGHSTSDSSVMPAESIIAHHNRCMHGLSNLEPFVVVRTSAEDVFAPIHDFYRTHE